MVKQRRKQARQDPCAGDSRGQAERNRNQSLPNHKRENVARTLQQVWLSSLIGWVGGVDDPSRVVTDLETATQLLLGDGAVDGARPES